MRQLIIAIKYAVAAASKLTDFNREKCHKFPVLLCSFAHTYLGLWPYAVSDKENSIKQTAMDQNLLKVKISDVG